MPLNSDNTNPKSDNKTGKGEHGNPVTSSGVETVNREPAKATDNGRAAESSDPAVHKLLADLDIAQQNGDDAAVKRYTDELKKLGFKQ